MQWKLIPSEAIWLAILNNNIQSSFHDFTLVYFFFSSTKQREENWKRKYLLCWVFCVFFKKKWIEMKPFLVRWNSLSRRREDGGWSSFETFSLLSPKILEKVSEATGALSLFFLVENRNRERPQTNAL